MPSARSSIIPAMRRTAARKRPGSNPDKLAFIEGLRGIAALYVVFTHFGSMIDPSHLAGTRSSAPAWLQALIHPFWYGHLAVAAFIVLSGYCLQTSLFGSGSGRIKSLKKFFKRRARRILPPYYAALALSIVVAVTVTSKQAGMPFSQYVPVTRGNIAAHALMVHNLSADWMYKLNGVLWSIAIEWQLYLVFPLLVLLLFRVGRFAYVGLTSILAALVLWQVDEAAKFYVWYLPLFALGMAASHLAYRPNVRVGIVPRLAAWVFVGASAACVAACINPIVDKHLIIPVRDAFVGIAVASLVYLGTVAPWTPFTKLFAWQPIASLGFFSYSLYLMHHPILQVLYVYRPSWIDGPVSGGVYMLAVCLPIILVACYLFSRIFEVPFMAAKRSRVATLEIGAPVALPLVSGLAVVHTERAARAEALAHATIANAERVAS